MKNLETLSRTARIYVLSVTICGSAAVIASTIELFSRGLPSGWLLLAALTLLSGSITVKVPSVPATISVSETFVFTAVLLFGPSAGTLIVALDGLVISLWLHRKLKMAYQSAFNMAAPALSVYVSATLFFALAGITPLASGPATPISALLLPLAVFTGFYFLLNSGLIALAIAFEKSVSAVAVWRENFLWLGLNYFGGASVAALLVAYTKRIDWASVGIIVPLLVISYLTYKTAMGRLEDTTSHLSQLNVLYLSTIETLARAIDARDQVTHGHIRRVQVYAIALARRLGITDALLLKAIEAAALLHDLGKLRVPEQILNKPGRLTSIEFERIKSHSQAGAEILASIEFPYPVVPIVKHHHENWDGSGYPDGLAGTNIPIGARVLAVVDCFDALTSDRPYRGALPDSAAVQILVERRGSMYDPVVVDAFIAIHHELSRSEVTVGPRPGYEGPETSLAEIQSLANAVSGRTQRASSDVIPGWRPAVATQPGFEVLADCLERMAGFNHVKAMALYVPGRRPDSMVLAGTAGHRELLRLIAPPREGGALTSWVASNQKPIETASVELEVGPQLRASIPGADVCASVPLRSEGRLVGVLTTFGQEPGALAKDARELAEIITDAIVAGVGPLPSLAGQGDLLVSIDAPTRNRQGAGGGCRPDKYHRAQESLS